MVNACSHYRFCRCGNLDDTKTQSVCNNNWGDVSLQTFKDGHSYCEFVSGYTGFNNCAFKIACDNGADSDCWEKEK